MIQVDFDGPQIEQRPGHLKLYFEIDHEPTDKRIGVITGGLSPEHILNLAKCFHQSVCVVAIKKGELDERVPVYKILPV